MQSGRKGSDLVGDEYFPHLLRISLPDHGFCAWAREDNKKLQQRETSFCILRRKG
jgi:hypothetical protein